jgi:cytochrome o ubiquinol oxidase subunit 2
VKHPSLVTCGRVLALGALLMLGGCNLEILSPKGDIGMQEKQLILTALGLMLIVVIPVIFMTVYFAWKYRASNTAADYAPRWSHSTGIEVVVWTIPCIIVGILAVITWRTSHSLDPYRPLDARATPVQVDVVSLDWKWLFIYPQYGIASVNELAFPVDTPVNFRITSATVMNSFFIPQLGSQIYSMAGMETQLHLNARAAGTYAGISANYSGAGFSGMKFNAIATTQEGFRDWIQKARAANRPLDNATYDALNKPSVNVPATLYSSAPGGMFDFILHRHMNEMAGLPADYCAPALPSTQMATAER